MLLHYRPGDAGYTHSRSGVASYRGAEETASDATAATLAGAWAGERLYLNSDPGGTNVGHNALIYVKVASGVQSMAYMDNLGEYSISRRLLQRTHRR